MSDSKNTGRIRRITRIRSKVSGSAERPRLCVNFSNRHIFVQIIDDNSGQTLAALTTVGVKSLADKNMTDMAIWAGENIAKKALQAKISKVSLDRRGKKYHGRLAALAQSARNQGLEF